MYPGSAATLRHRNAFIKCARRFFQIVPLSLQVGQPHHGPACNGQRATFLVSSQVNRSFKNTSRLVQPRQLRQRANGNHQVSCLHAHAHSLIEDLATRNHLAVDHVGCAQDPSSQAAQKHLILGKLLERLAGERSGACDASLKGSYKRAQGGNPTSDRFRVQVQISYALLNLVRWPTSQHERPRVK